MLNGRFAGKKAVIVNVISRKTKSRKYSHCVVAGINRYPRKVTRSMSLKRIKRRSRIVPFVKIVNVSHVLPTRFEIILVFYKKKYNIKLHFIISYNADMELEKIASPERVAQPKQRVILRRQIRKIFNKKFANILIFIKVILYNVFVIFSFL